MPETKTSEQLKEKIDSFRQSVFSAKKENSSHHVGIALAVICDLLAGLLVGAIIGFMLYKYMHFHLIFFGIFIFLGGIAGVLNVFKTLSKLNKKGDNDAT